MQREKAGQPHCSVLFLFIGWTKLFQQKGFVKRALGVEPLLDPSASFGQEKERKHLLQTFVSLSVEEYGETKTSARCRMITSLQVFLEVPEHLRIIFLRCTRILTPFFAFS